MKKKESDAKRISEIIGTLEAIEITRKSMKEAEAQAKRRSEQQSRLVAARKNNSITEDEYQAHRTMLFEAATEYGPAASTTGIEKVLQMEETALELFVKLAPQNQISEKNKEKLLKIASDREAQFNIQQIKEDLTQGFTEEQLRAVEEETGKRASTDESKKDSAANPVQEIAKKSTRELVESFKVMALTIKGAIEKLEESISFLKDFLDEVEKNNKKKKEASNEMTEAHTPVASEKVKEETPETTNDPYAAMENSNDEKAKDELIQDSSFFDQKQANTGGTSMDCDEIDEDEDEDEKRLIKGGLA